MLNEFDIKNLLDTYEPLVRAERTRLDVLKNYMEGEHDPPYRPPNSESDLQYNILARRSVTNLLPMIRNASSQQLQVDGVTTGTSEEDIVAWKIWQKNGFDKRHVQIFTSALTYGMAYAYAIRDKKDNIVMRGLSARHMYAVYEDPVSDEFPEYGFRQKESGEVYEVWDDLYIYEITSSIAIASDGKEYRTVVIDDFYPHGSSACPIVRFAPTMDLDGNCLGEIEPVLVIQDRINQVSFDLLLTQHYTAFKIRGFSGVKQALDKVTGKPVAVKMSPDNVALLPDADSRAWQLDGSDLTGIIASFELAVHDLAVASQTPAHYMLGNMVNLSAEALAAAETTLTRKITTYKLTLGEPVEQLLRLASLLAGVEFPEDAEITWADRESRSLSQVADALNKYLALGVPEEALWSMIPNVSRTEVERWKELKALEPNPVVEPPVIPPGS